MKFLWAVWTWLSPFTAEVQELDYRLSSLEHPINKIIDGLLK